MGREGEGKVVGVVVVVILGCLTSAVLCDN